MKLNVMAGALTTAIVGAIGTLVVSIAASIIPPLAALIKPFIPHSLGASLTVGGTILGIIYNSIGGFVGAYIVISIYNYLVDFLAKKA